MVVNLKSVAYNEFKGRWKGLFARVLKCYCLLASPLTDGIGLFQNPVLIVNIGEC